MKQKPPLEKDIQNACCEYLAMKHYFFWRQNTIPVYNKELNRFRAMPKYGMKGIPDVILIKEKQVIFLEIKRPTGQLSEHQITFRTNCIKRGIPYHIITSIDDLIEIGL